MIPVARFDWDADKERSNFRKHRVTFAEAQTVFEDDVARIEDDPDHSVGEHREVIIGYSREGRLLVGASSNVEKPSASSVPAA